MLVVEDDDDLRAALCEGLAFEGYHPIGCRNGEAAWTRLTCGLRPTVVVTDLALPGLSGRQLVSRIRAQAWGQRLPVLLLSGWENAERFDVAATAVLVKGAEPETFARAVDRLAGWGRTTARRPAARAGGIARQRVGATRAKSGPSSG